MKSLLKKARENKKGFTLAELLVVVAIVGILVAISIPVFTAQLGKARRATNNANLRAAKAAAVADYLTGDDTDGSNAIYEYNIDAGSVSTAASVSDKCDEVEIGKNSGDNSVSDKVVYNHIFVTITGSETDSGDVDNESVTLSAGNYAN